VLYNSAVTIHPDHPFVTPVAERDPVRRFRGRMPQPVTLWCAGSGAERAGWTVSSLLVAEGRPAALAGLVDVDSDLAERVVETGRVAVSLLDWEHRALGDAFAGLAPAPGGVFRLGDWQQTEWGPVLARTPGWLGAVVVDATRRLGWSLLVEASIEHVAIGTEDVALLTHVRGRYRSLPPE
jgi:flavin reductase (DIM6/NTAB) family NADH-FMN oxidoreductase RutF